MFKTPHFFKAYSRLGLTNNPIRQNSKNFGVEDAPNAILTPEFLESFSEYKLDEFEFPKPEEVDKKDYLKVLILNSLLFKEFINKNLKKNQTPVVVGGDHSVTFSSLLALQERMDINSLGILHFDSHADSNSFNASPSKNFHGMYLRPFLDHFDISLIND